MKEQFAFAIIDDDGILWWNTSYKSACIFETEKQALSAAEEGERIVRVRIVLSDAV